MRHTILINLVALGAILACGFCAAGLDSMNAPPKDYAGLDAHESHAAASLLGQFRTNVSSWLWLRTDLYLHNGVEMRPLSEEEVKAGRKGVGGAEDKGHERIMNDDVIVTVVPPPERDFRGLLGDIERETSTYKHMEHHAHNDPGALLPLFRLMTWLDPQFLAAWVTGATVMAQNRSEEGTTKAIEFLEEGQRENPKSIAIRVEIARLLISRRKDIAGALPWLERAAKDGLVAPNALPEIEHEGLDLGCRLLVLAYRDLGRSKEMQEFARKAIAAFPDDAILTRALGGR